MHTSVTFRRMDSSEALRLHAEEKLQKLVRLIGDKVDAHVTLSTEKKAFLAEIHLSTHGFFVNAKESSSDMYNSIERAAEKVEKQIKKFRERIKDHQPRAGSKQRMKHNVVELDMATSDVAHFPQIVETSEFEARPMSLDEAVTQMEISQNRALVFVDPKSSHVHVLYRKSEHQFGLIETHIKPSHA